MKGIEDVLEFEPEFEEVLDRFEIHRAGIEMDVKSAALIHRGTGGFQRGGGDSNFLDTGLAFKDRRDEF